jgi:6-phosphogluconolactonase/glucosamine-6-phosphate isomerase/deaminase
MTLTYSGIALGELVVITVIGKARAEVVRKIADGEDYPASRVHATKLIWLVDTAAAALLEGEAP